MAGILDFLGGDNLQQLVKGLSEKTGIGADKVSSVVDSFKSIYYEIGRASCRERV